MRKVVIVALVYLVAGCSFTQMYEGPKLPENEVAKINGTSSLEGMGYAASVCKINDKDLPSCITDIELIPGEYSFKLGLTYFGVTQQYTETSKVLKAGDRYLLGLQYSTGGREPWPNMWLDKNINE